MCRMSLNQELNGIELYFDQKPPQTIIDNLKSNKFRWSGFKKCWYAKQSEKSFKVAEALTEENNTTITETKTEKQTITKPILNKFNLWDATQWTEQNNVNEKMPVKEIAAGIRKQVKAHLPNCKFSITSDYNSIHFNIVSTPYDKESQYLKAIENYCTNLLKSYNYCTCYDPYGDYGSSHNFYGSYANISYDYKQTEQTEEIKEDMINFDNRKAQQEKEEEEQREREYQERIKQQEQDNKNHELWKIEEAKQIEAINSNINIVDLKEEKQYFVIGSQFANLNKNNTLDQYKEEVSNGKFYLQNVKITKEVHFQSAESLNYFSNMLLNDFDFLVNTGGSFTDDNRINSMTDYNNMTEEERETVIFNLYGVAIYHNNELKFVVDAQGYSYSRYVGLVDNVTIEKSINTKQYINDEELQELKNRAETLTDFSVETITELDIIKTWNNDNWQEYKEAIKEQFKKNHFKLSKEIIQQLPNELEELKVVMYKLLMEVDGIQDQFKNADLQQGQKLTLIYISDWGSIVTKRIILDSVEYKSYAQYDKAVKLTFKPKNKRKLHYNYWYGDILVYNSWLELPEEVLHTIEKTGTGMTITSTKYMSCDKRQYDDILEYFGTNGIKPIVNTYKPIF